MIKDRETNYSENSGLILLQNLFEEGHYIFTSDKACTVGQKCNISKNYLSQLLHLLEKSGWIIRLKRGLYALKEGFPGNIQLHPFAIATSVVTPSVISHWSAMNYHGLTEQIPVNITAMTTKKIITPDMRTGKRTGHKEKHFREIMDVNYEYITVRPEFFFGFEEVWINQHFKIKITNKERTVLEGFASPGFFGGIGEILGILEDHIKEFNLDSLISYALRYNKGSVIKRLGWALENTGISREETLPLYEIPVSGYRLLDPTEPAGGLVINTGIFR